MSAKDELKRAIDQQDKTRQAALTAWHAAWDEYCKQEAELSRLRQEYYELYVAPAVQS